MTQIKTFKGKVTQAYPSKMGNSGSLTPNNLVLETGEKIACWTNKVPIADVHAMIGNNYVFVTSSSSEFNGVTTYTCDAFEPLSDTPTKEPEYSTRGDDEPEGDSSSPVVQKYISRDDSIIRQVAFKEAMNLTIASCITVEGLSLENFNALTNNLYAIAKGTYVPPEPIEIEDEVTPDEEQPGLFPDNNTSPF
tara:strand:- start:613 stop:1191 length:579 start_codon:yes stop_codon:yes gene_type:complete